MYISQSTRQHITKTLLEACAQKAGSQAKFAQAFNLYPMVFWRAKQSGCCSPKLFYICISYLGFRESIELIESTINGMGGNIGTVEEFLNENVDNTKPGLYKKEKPGE